MAVEPRAYRTRKSSTHTREVRAEVVPDALLQRVSLLEQQIAQLVAHVKQLDDDARRLVDVAKALDARIDGLAIIERAA